MIAWNTRVCTPLSMHRVQAVQDQADDERERERPQQPAQAETRVGGAGRVAVNAGRVVGRWQGLDLGQQLR
jgi:hypothetical protein